MKTAMSVPKKLHGGEADVLEDLLVLADRELAEQQSRQRHQEGEEDEVVEDALPHGLAEGVGGDGQQAAHPSPHEPAPPPARPPSRGRSSPRASAARAARRGRGRPPPRPRPRPPELRLLHLEAQPLPDRLATGAARGPEASGARPATSISMCATSSRSSSPSAPTLRSRPARRTRHPVAQRLGVGEDVGREEDGLARLAQAEDEVADEPPADRVEARHRLVEDDELGVVDEGLREPGPLHHPLGEAAERKVRRSARAPRAPGARRVRSRRRGAGRPKSRPT